MCAKLWMCHVLFFLLSPGGSFPHLKLEIEFTGHSWASLALTMRIVKMGGASEVAGLSNTLLGDLGPKHRSEQLDSSNAARSSEGCRFGQGRSIRRENILIHRASGWIQWFGALIWW